MYYMFVTIFLLWLNYVFGRPGTSKETGPHFGALHRGQRLRMTENDAPVSGSGGSIRIIRVTSGIGVDLVSDVLSAPPIWIVETLD